MRLSNAGASRLRVLAAALALAAGWAHAQSLIQGPAGTVDGTDVRAAMQSVPLASRQAMLARPDTVLRQAENLYLRRALAAEAVRDGLDKDPMVAEALRQARERILSDARLAAIERAALPPDSEITRYARDLYLQDPAKYRTPEQTRASHILVARSPDGKARERAEALLARVRAGESFETLAREHSADGASASKGGDLGWFVSGQMVKPFEEAVAALKNPGELAPIVETQFGFHVVRLDGRRPAGERSFDEVREAIEADVRAKAQREARQAKARELLRDAKPDIAAIEAFARQQPRP
ncbi:MAG: peptidylprolyl isomerase [Rubrivivax sp.]|nr:peptidylprolyl isomerase [Rubrivivax sp.]